MRLPSPENGQVCCPRSGRLIRGRCQSIDGFRYTTEGSLDFIAYAAGVTEAQFALTPTITSLPELVGSAANTTYLYFNHRCLNSHSVTRLSEMRFSSTSNTMKHIATFFIIALVAATGEEVPGVVPRPKAPVSGFEEVGLHDVRLQGGFWGPRLDIHHKTTIPHVLDKLEERHHFRNFDIAAEVLKGKADKSGEAGSGTNAVDSE